MFVKRLNLFIFQGSNTGSKVNAEIKNRSLWELTPSRFFANTPLIMLTVKDRNNFCLKMLDFMFILVHREREPPDTREGKTKIIFLSKKIFHTD